MKYLLGRLTGDVLRMNAGDVIVRRWFRPAETLDKDIARMLDMRVSPFTNVPHSYKKS